MYDDGRGSLIPPQKSHPRSPVSATLSLTLAPNTPTPSAKHTCDTQDNFVEALKRPYLAYQPFGLPDHTQALFSDPEVTALGPNTADFWVVVRAIKDFTEVRSFGGVSGSGFGGGWAWGKGVSLLVGKPV